MHDGDLMTHRTLDCPLYGRPQPGRPHPSCDVGQPSPKIRPALHPAERDARGTRGSGFGPAKVLVRGLHRYPDRPLLWRHLDVSHLSLWFTEGVQAGERTLLEHAVQAGRPVALLILGGIILFMVYNSVFFSMVTSGLFF